MPERPESAGRRGRMVAAIGAGVLALGLLLSGCGGSSSADDGGKQAFAGVDHDAYDVAPTALTDTDGASYSLTEDTDKPLTMVFFGYTHCPDICPMVMSSISSAMTRLSDEDRADVDMVFVTTDPARDDEQTLRKYLDGYDPEFIGLTGDLKTVAKVGKPLHIYVAEGDTLPSGGIDLGAHSTQVSAIGPDNKSHVLWTQETSSAEFAADIHALLEEYR